MPVPGSGSGGGNRGPKDRLLSLIEKWKSTWNLIQEADGTTDGGASNIEMMEDRLERLEDRIDRILEKRPNLVSVAQNNGYAVEASGPDKPKDKDGDGVPDNQQGDKPGTKPPGDRPGKNNKGGGKPGVTSGKKLPGKDGKDREFVNHGGKTYVVYKIKVKGKNLPGGAMWRVPDKDLAVYGLKKGEGRDLTKAQFKRLNHFGSLEELEINGKDHPFKLWVRKVTNKYGGTGLLKNRQVMELFLEGYAEGWDSEEIQGRLKQTKWWDESTRYQRDWSMNMSDKERGNAVASYEQKVVEALESLYGADWRKHVSDVEAKQAAKKIASGKWGLLGNPDSGFEDFITKEKNKAEKVEGSPAWIDKSQEQISQQEFMNGPEDLQTQLRQQVIEWLGYAGKENAALDRDALAKWAEDLFFERKSDADWEQFLRRQKQALYPYLDPDEKWMDAVSTYKSLAENLLGTTLSYDDPFFRNLMAADGEGKPINDGKTRMNMKDFELLIRGSDQFKTSAKYEEEATDIFSFLNQRFQGAA